MKRPSPLLGFVFGPPSPRGGMSNLVYFIFHFIAYGQLTFIQHCTVDHLARGSMKNAANCASECKLQDI